MRVVDLSEDSPAEKSFPTDHGGPMDEGGWPDGTGSQVNQGATAPEQRRQHEESRIGECLLSYRLQQETIDRVPKDKQYQGSNGSNDPITDRSSLPGVGQEDRTEKELFGQARDQESNRSESEKPARSIAGRLKPKLTDGQPQRQGKRSEHHEYDEALQPLSAVGPRCQGAGRPTKYGLKHQLDRNDYLHLRINDSPASSRPGSSTN